MKIRCTLFLLLVGSLLSLKAQYYYPPKTGSQWDTVSPASLGWCVGELDTLSDYVEARQSKSFIILHKGKIAFERYYNGHSQGDPWYWASAGKSLMAFLIGMAQQQGQLDINDQTSQYLDTGWTVAPRAKEDLITIKNQITMTTGLDFNVPDQNCLEDTCLKYLHDADTHWYYHNAPYRLTQDVVEEATGKGLNLFTIQSLGSAIGFSGLWINYVFSSNARKMARFGLLNLNRGVWDGVQVLTDTAYFNAMISSSQNLNPAYGYLWWLNGKSTFKQPGLDNTFNGPIIPTAPADLYMAAGANDQRIYIVPSLDLVVVRQGEEAYSSMAALSAFDPELWTLLMNVICTPVSLEEEPTEPRWSVYPNPAGEVLNFSRELSGICQVFDARGTVFLKLELKEDSSFKVDRLPQGLYYLRVGNATTSFVKK